ncbi:hypothetical protein OA977_01290 [Pelagibacteraceae bacterium]|nr:hypothetical protein [Pelagibacteraceae bacterium]
MTEKPIVVYTDHIMNRTLCYNFAKGSNSLLCHVNNFKEYDKTIATYGVLRGTYEVIKKVKNFYYIDHGYFNQSERKFENNRTNVLNLNGYFRIVYNNLVYSGDKNFPDDRLKKLNLNFIEQMNIGDSIILSEPSQTMKTIYNANNWIEETKQTIRKYSDRKIIVHNKFSKTPLDELLKNAWSFVSLQSTAGFKAMVNGIPAYFTEPSLKKINLIEEIENPKINYEIFNNLAYGQWTLKEIESGEAWEVISKNK